MIEWYDRHSFLVDLEEHISLAKKLGRQGHPKQAIGELIAGLHEIHADERSWERGLRLLYELFDHLDLTSEALTLAWYLVDRELMDSLLERVSASERARTLQAQAALGLVSAAEERARFGQAAVAFEAAELMVHAAVSYERAGDHQAARALWSRLAQAIDRQGNDPYAAGLAHFNLARSCQEQGESDAARTAAVDAVHRLEQAADQFEHGGRRERAFDCFQVLIRVGELHNSFEHILEGSVNAIRILRQDNLRHHALRLYQRTLQLADRASEYAAAATLAAEMSDYARSQALPQVTEYALGEQARAWHKLAESQRSREAPLEIIEPALHQSLLAYAELGQFAAVAKLYEALEHLSQGSSRERRYARARARTEHVKNESPPTRDSGLGPPDSIVDIWFEDLLEWEDAGSPSARCAEIILDPLAATDQVTRRSAVLGRLAALAAEKSPGDPDKSLRVLANQLAPIGLYQVLPALEMLFNRAEPAVRVAAIHALSRYAYKRSFATLERALVDSDTEVREAAVQAVRRQRFEQAFEPLARIFKSSGNTAARLAALHALAQLETPEAHELLLETLEHGTPSEAGAAADGLVQAHNTAFFEHARKALPNASPRLRTAIQRIMSLRKAATR